MQKIFKVILLNVKDGYLKLYKKNCLDTSCNRYGGRIQVLSPTSHVFEVFSVNIVWVFYVLLYISFFHYYYYLSKRVSEM